MKLIALGDTHGRPYWKTAVETAEADKVLFIGDYFDSREFITERQQIKNFRDIIAFKQSHPEKVILLTGNHDYHYLPFVNEKYSLYQPSFAVEIGQLLIEALSENLLQMCYLHRHFLFTHAGVTKTWSNKNQVDILDIENSINSLFKNKPEAFKFTPGRNNSSRGEDVTQSPIWVRPGSLLMDKIDDFTQIVGHTPQESMQLSDEVIFIDTLGSTGQFLTIENEVLSVSGYEGYSVSNDR